MYIIILEVVRVCQMLRPHESILIMEETGVLHRNLSFLDKLVVNLVYADQISNIPVTFKKEIIFERYGKVSLRN